MVELGRDLRSCGDIDHSGRDGCDEASVADEVVRGQIFDGLKDAHEVGLKGASWLFVMAHTAFEDGTLTPTPWPWETPFTKSSCRAPRER